MTATPRGVARIALLGVGVLACARPMRMRATMEPGIVPANWYAGDARCSGSPPVRVQPYNEGLFILRQSACTNYEKPFLYLLLGRDRALLFDSGAGNVDIVTPVDTLVRAWQARHGGAPVALIVAHSHAHGDHVAGDTLFARRAGTVVVGRDTASVRAFFHVNSWPDGFGSIDLGDRVLDVIPIPGHQPASIALYDRATGVLLTGDTFYPGRLYVRDTAAFARSIDRLTMFARAHAVTHLLGAHVEQRRMPYSDYTVGTVDQPDEHGLDLDLPQLEQLDAVVQAMRGRFVKASLPAVTVWPLP
jgi:hydroxyacylglutathione hydrolase